MRKSTIVLATAVILGWICVAINLSEWDPVAADYGVFWRGVRLANPYVDNIFPYPPTSLIFWKLLSFVPYWVGYAMLWLVSLPAFFLAARHHFGPRIALLALVSAAAIEGLVVGQFAMLFAAAILWAFALPGAKRGIILGIVAAIKPQLLILAPLAFLVRRDWAALAGMAASGIGMVAVSLLFGPRLWLDWLGSLDEFREFLIFHSTLARVIAPAGTADHYGLTAWPFLLAGIALACLVTAKVARKVDGGVLAGIIVALSTLAAPYALPHDTLTAVPLACLVLLRPKISLATLLAVFYFAGEGILPATLGAIILYFMASPNGRVLNSIESPDRPGGDGAGGLQPAK